MRTFYVRLTVLNTIINKEAEKMIRLNRYKRNEAGKYTKDITIKCNCKTVEAATNYIMNKFSSVAEANKIKYKVEIFNDKKYKNKLAERLTKSYKSNKI